MPMATSTWAASHSPRLSDFRGDASSRVVQLVQQTSDSPRFPVGGEPWIRHRELSRILPALSEVVYSLSGDQRRDSHFRSSG